MDIIGFGGGSGFGFGASAWGAASVAAGGGDFGGAAAGGDITISIVGLIPIFFNNSLALSLISFVIALFPPLVFFVSWLIISCNLVI